MPLPALVSCCRSVLAAAAVAALLPAASAQSEGGLYIAGDGFSFQAAAQRALAQNMPGQRFFLLTLPPETKALQFNAPPATRRLRERVSAANGVLLVCRRDLDNRRVDAARLAPEVVPVRGWPEAGQPSVPAGQRYVAGENPEHLPASNEALRRLRAACS
jgi:hypothetical protein